MRITIGSLVITALLGVASVAGADPVLPGQTIQLQVTDNNGVQYGRVQGGGPFRVDLPGTVDDFVSFCLEITEGTAFGQDLLVVAIGDEARPGGAGGIPAGGTGDPISATTAFLYTQFRARVAGYLDAFTMQHAIWYLEDEEFIPFSAAVTALLQQAATDMSAAGWGPGTLGTVRVLNLVRAADGGSNQDVLVIVPPPDDIPAIPEPATLLLVGAGLATGLGRRLKRRRPEAAGTGRE